MDYQAQGKAKYLIDKEKMTKALPSYYKSITSSRKRKRDYSNPLSGMIVGKNIRSKPPITISVATSWGDYS